MHEAEQLTSFETTRSICIRVGSSDREFKLFAAYKPPGTRMLIIEDAEEYELLGPNTPMHVPTDPRHRPNVLDIVLGHKISWPVHVEVVYGMNTQPLSILVNVGTGMPYSPPATSRQYMDWEDFQTSLETLHLGSLFETAANMEASANLLVDRIREAQSRATTLLLASTSCRSDLLQNIKMRLRHNAGYISCGPAPAVSS
ncbi:hypothetical protein EVAR_50963_1 [Eumeta japonica]|uniref:Uncharacterized protein n=1 Tax=Eumeta variegata TaxID=151549 RepID=A0A4C1XE47_EUMVA|nr:hypothetical protein EVAR_50963_1 [Eumeta japonica]